MNPPGNCTVNDSRTETRRDFEKSRQTTREIDRHTGLSNICGTTAMDLNFFTVFLNLRVARLLDGVELTVLLTDSPPTHPLSRSTTFLNNPVPSVRPALNYEQLPAVVHHRCPQYSQGTSINTCSRPIGGHLLVRLTSAFFNFG